MSYGPNRWGVHPGSRVIQAGGIKMFYRHPKLAGHVANGINIDEVDVSKACKLNDTFFDAQPAMDSAFQEVLVDGSVITITNKLLAGTITLQVLEQGGFVGTGDFITALQLVQSNGDSVGGTFTVIRNFSGKVRVRVYYGVFARNVPHERVAGNAVVPYPVQLYYAGWFDGVGKGDAVQSYIWAVGNNRGVSGTYDQLLENKKDTTEENGGDVAIVPQHSNNVGGAVDDLTAFADEPDALAVGAVGLAAYPYGNLVGTQQITPPAATPVAEE